MPFYDACYQQFRLHQTLGQGMTMILNPYLDILRSPLRLRTGDLMLVTPGLRARLRGYRLGAVRIHEEQDTHFADLLGGKVKGCVPDKLSSQSGSESVELQKMNKV